MEDEEEAPLAVEIGSLPDANRTDDGDISVGITVITGYLGAGKSTVLFSVAFLLLNLVQISC